MAEFTYEALGSTGQRTTGVLTAASERDVVAQLDAKGLFPVKIEAAALASARSWGGKKVRGRFMATFYSQLADLLKAGVPLLRSLDILERQSAQAVLAEVLREIRADVADGTTLADAMNQHPRVFNELAVSMVRAGQEGGFLEDVLKRIADFTEKQEDLKAKVIGAMAYPIILIVVGFLVLNVLVIFFVPRFEPIFKKLDDKGELPDLTKFILGGSHYLQSWAGLLTAAAVVLAVVGFVLWGRTKTGRYRVDGWRLRLPGAGSIYLNLAIARFARILGTLLHNGIPILQALRISKDSTGNRVLTEAIGKASDNITAGNTLAGPLGTSKLFPRDVVEMIAVGQESNNLEGVLLSIADGLEKRTSRQLDLFVSLLGPVLLLFMAAVTLIVLLGLLLPIFKMSSAIR